MVHPPSAAAMKRATPRIVSVTPMAVSCDSRTFKIAASIGRFGFESVVVEGEPGSPPSAVSDYFTLVSCSKPRQLLSWEQGSEPSRLGDSLFAGVLGLAAAIKGVLDLSIRTYRCMPRADLYYLHCYLQYPAVRLRCKKDGVSFVYDAHDFYSVLSDDGREITRATKFISMFHLALERMCVRKAAACVTVSDGVAALEEEKFGRTFVVLRNVHDSRFDDPGYPSMRDQLRLGDAFLMVVVGNAKPGGMAVEQSIRALSELDSDVHLLFLGRGYEPYLDLARNLGVAGRVHAPGPVALEEVAGAIRGANVAPVLYWGVNSNLERCMPNGFFHVVASGIPVLYSVNLPDVALLASRYGLGLEFDPTDISSFVDSVKRFRGDPRQAADFQSAALIAASEISWESEEEILGRVLEPLIAPEGRIGE